MRRTGNWYIVNMSLVRDMARKKTIKIGIRQQLEVIVRNGIACFNRNYKANGEEYSVALGYISEDNLNLLTSAEYLDILPREITVSEENLSSYSCKGSSSDQQDVSATEDVVVDSLPDKISKEEFYARFVAAQERIAAALEKKNEIDSDRLKFERDRYSSQKKQREAEFELNKERQEMLAKRQSK